MVKLRVKISENDMKRIDNQNTGSVCSLMVPLLFWLWYLSHNRGTIFVINDNVNKSWNVKLVVFCHKQLNINLSSFNMLSYQYLFFWFKDFTIFSLPFNFSGNVIQCIHAIGIEVLYHILRWPSWIIVLISCLIFYRSSV